MTAERHMPEPDARRHEDAMSIVQKYVILSGAAGMVPIPVFDVFTLAGVHIALIKEISEHYGIEFSQHTARNILIAIGAGLIPGSFGSILGRKMLKLIPFTIGVVGSGLFSAAVSYALGTLFIRHFEGGGTLDSFDADDLHRLFHRRAIEAS